jgi:NAD-dependent dihydropyrimidine dehydrogenase PreA subunit
MNDTSDSPLASSSAGHPDTAANHPDCATAFNPIRIDEQKCVRCDLCDWICPGDLIYHAEGDKTKLPVVVYPDECWYCGLCQSICPTQAIEVIFPERMLRNRTDVATLLGKIDE